MSTADGPSAWWVALGGAIFLGGAGWFVLAVVTGGGVLRALGTNGLGAAVLIAWAGRDALVDSDSEVTSVGGAAGTALLLYGAYLVAAGVVLLATAPWHGLFVVGLLYGGLGVAAGLVGVFAVPVGESAAATDG